MAVSARRKKKTVRKQIKLKIRKGDTVKVMAGKDKGKEGEVVSTLPGKGKAIVSQINVSRKAVRPHPQKNPQGGIVEIPAPIDVTNLRLICPRCSKMTKVSFSKSTEGKTSRKCKKCGELIDG
jgi:large subunit ribosomal protein L24